MQRWPLMYQVVSKALSPLKSESIKACTFSFSWASSSRVNFMFVRRATFCWPVQPLEYFRKGATCPTQMTNRHSGRE
ncbi:hypothetical protein FGO68_gene15989 [Halteria grandinella]|uniref:Uncharacterized protein n=1 Tax=Halteria grandinella TaxID=5974 RepID=A0A8J8P8R6_HALGN|nr:hypothetical protein FGO68_gene15989 [Halteria grandinella]